MTIELRKDPHRAVESRREESDEALLRAFVNDRDDLVFARLVTRHAGLVMEVCRQVLSNAQEVEDAFQATFLVLARKAGSLRSGKSLPAWLHKTAHRIALRARSSKARRRELPLESEAMAQDCTAFQRISMEHDRSVVDEELNRLPDRYRLPLFLCCIEGKTRDEAARQLGWSMGSLKGRLERARQLLHSRLILRGVTLSVAAALLMRSQALAQVSVPPSLVVSTVQAGLRFAAGNSPVGYVSPNSLSLANWSLQAMSISMFKVVACSLLVIGALTLGNRWIFKPAAAEAREIPVVVVPPAEASVPDYTFVAFVADEREEGEERERAARREREQREAAARRELSGEQRERLEQLRRRHAELREAGSVEDAQAVEREIKQLLERANAAKREEGERRALPGEVREKLEQMKRRQAELREAGKADEARGVEREIKQLLERTSAAKREEGERREVPGEVREKLEQLKRRHAELREAGKADEARGVEREIQQLTQRFSAPRREGERRENEIGERLRHLRAAHENLRAAGLNDLANQVAEQIGRLEREAGNRREGESGERSEADRREAEARERQEREQRERRERE